MKNVFLVLYIVCIILELVYFFKYLGLNDIYDRHDTLIKVMIFMCLVHIFADLSRCFE